MAATPDQISQQQRIIIAFQQNVRAQLDLFVRLQGNIDTFDRLQLSLDTVLDPTAINGTGTTVVDYRAAIASIRSMLVLIPTGQFAPNLEKVSR